MSKSIGNIFLLREALKEYRPEVLICYFVGSHYRSPMEFSSELLDEAGQQVERLRNLFRSLDDCVERTPPVGTGEADLALAVALDERRRALRRRPGRRSQHRRGPGRGLRVGPGGQHSLGRRLVSAAAARVVREGVADMIHILGLDAVAETTSDIPDDVLRMAAERHAGRAGQGLRRRRPPARRDRGSGLRGARRPRGLQGRTGGVMAAAAPLPKRGRRHDRGASGRRPEPAAAAPIRRWPLLDCQRGRGDVVYGRNAVREVIRAGRRRVTHVWVHGWRGRPGPRARDVPLGRRRREHGPAADAAAGVRCHCPGGVARSPGHRGRDRPIPLRPGGDRALIGTIC